ncbi:MAG: hypothetical protein PHW69_06530 [Elusimicrobiaceae bacterium]|nr:hypothetical protein [Elusimicrobiaceae bacterium]
MNRKGLCLAEFLIALGLLSGMVITASAVSMYVSKTGANIDKSILPVTEANLAAEAIVQRIKRAPRYSGNECFAITNSNKTVTYRDASNSRTEEFALVGDQLRYRPDTRSTAYDVVLNGVNNVQFSNDTRRLSVAITMNSVSATGEKPVVRTGVFPLTTVTASGAGITVRASCN